jgi:HK97 family phage major capsid protein
MLPGAYAKNAKFAMSYATLFGKIYPLMTSTGEFIFADSKTGGVNRLFGFPIVIDDNIPVGNVIFGNFKYYGVNIPESVVIEVSRDSGFTSGLIDYRALCIADGKPILPDAFVKLTEETA